MISCLPAVFTLVFALFFSAAAWGRSIELFPAAKDSLYFIAVVESDDTRERIVSSVRKRAGADGDRWEEVAILRSPLLGIAIANDRLAILTDDGQWRLDGSVPGPPLPAGRIERLITGRDQMLAVGVVAGPTDQSNVRTIWAWTGVTWRRVIDLPDTGRRPPQVVESAAGITIAVETESDLEIAILRDGKWSQEPPRAGAASALLLPTGTGYALLERPGEKTILVRDGRDTPLDTSGFGQPTTAVVVDKSLRLLKPGENAVEQLTLNYATGERITGPSSVGQVVTGPPPASMWSQFGLMALLAIAVVLTMRQSPVPPPELLAAADIRIAPLGRRLVGGLIDAVPYIIGTAITVRMISNNQVPFDRSMLSVAPTVIGLAIYVGHTAIVEAIFGRSIGKMLTGLRVISYDGSRPGPTRLIMRNLLRVLDIFMMLMPLLLVLISPTRQRIGDLASGTLVVQQNKSASTPSPMG